MLNFNGQLISPTSDFNNRGFKFGDALFETIRVKSSKICFWEDHYLRLMAAMRIIRMEIPMNFTMEFLETEILKLIEAKNLSSSSARIRLTVYRNDAGYYLPESNTVSYIIEAEKLAHAYYTINKERCVVDLFKDHQINPGLLSTLKTNNRILNILGSIYAAENDYDNCLLLNQEKNVVEALNGNIFMITEGVVKTPPITDGCINGIMRKQLIRIIRKNTTHTIKEVSILPFELQKADELFITNVISGIQPITNYRKKEYEPTIAVELNAILNSITPETVL